VLRKRGTCQGSSREPRIFPVIGADTRLFERIADMIVGFQKRLNALAKLQTGGYARSSPAARSTASS
jgi:hypothetical protein